MRAATSKPVVAGGLCVSCNHRPMCMYLRESEVPIMQCDEYDDFSPPDTLGRYAMAQASQAQTDETAELQGLCRTCERRSTCMHAKSGFVFWQCEDYV